LSSAASASSGCIAYLALGSNLGDRAAHLAAAQAGLAALPGCRVETLSPIYETAPLGPGPQADYLNAVLRLHTTLEPLALLDAALALEAARGRVRRERWGARTLDIDLLLMGELSLAHPRLTLPHPALLTRAFVLAPLADLAPDLVLAGRSVARHLAALDRSGVRRYVAPPPHASAASA
jgi:2-amino-4-hydroxy-6-hydroxymethyldihydropteridine diphosphokinase